jgi:hypothetical protein
LIAANRLGKKQALFCICRGIIGHEYLKGVPLTGPSAGEVFDLRGSGNEKDGQKKLPWKAEHRKLLQEWLQEKVQKLLMVNE